MGSHTARSSPRGRGRNGAHETLHERLGPGLGLDGPLLQLVDLLEFLFDPSVPQVEGDLLLLALCVQLAWRHREHEVSILFIVDDFERQAAL